MSVSASLFSIFRFATSGLATGVARGHYQSSRRKQRRQRLSWLVLMTVLFQQFALAAYACPLAAETVPREPMPVMANCTGMEQPTPRTSALCNQHCLHEHATGIDLKAPQVPALALPLFRFTLSMALSGPPVDLAGYRQVPSCHADPPLAQRFCSFQI